MRDHTGDTVTITLSDNDESGMYVINTDSMDSSTISVDTTAFDDLISVDDQVYTLTGLDPVEFEDHMPSVSKVEDMCNEYSALQKAYENFKSIYHMVHQDYIGNRKDNEAPF
tara:strand:+ start:216 stop:551 length:336 start_codon:yes stop_codon:yes gene_type:complete